MNSQNGWFDVDVAGLRQLMAGREKSFVIKELLQNAFDEEGVSFVRLLLEPLPGRPAALLEVEDDAPEGFYDLTHAYTLYASNRKRPNPLKRGRFNLGEKLVLALCRNATIRTTTGSIRFYPDGTRERDGRDKRQDGSIFAAEIAMTRTEIAQAVEIAQSIIPPEGIEVTVNNRPLARRFPIAMLDGITLETEYSDEGGNWRTTRRQTAVHIYEPVSRGVPSIYEMGIPIVETGDKWDYDILQRVPLTADRDSVKPSFLRDVRAEVLNRLADHLSEEDAADAWVSDATEDERVESDAVETVMTMRFGEKRCVADPTDPRSREKAVAAGYTIVPPRSMSRSAWANVKRAKAIPSSSNIFPTTAADSEDVKLEDWTPEMSDFAALVRRVAKLTVGVDAVVSIYKAPKATNTADYMRGGSFGFNFSKLGRKWFAAENREQQLRLIVHELGHEFGGHLDESYYNGLARIGAKLALLSPGDILGE